MAPPFQPSAVTDTRGQILDNCLFCYGEDEEIRVNTLKEPTGQWKAIVLLATKNSRKLLLSSELCDTSHMAYESLHVKSAEAVNQYIQTNGYDLPPHSKKGVDDSDDETASIISGNSASSSVVLSSWDSSDEDAATPASSSPGGRSEPKALGKSRKTKEGPLPKTSKKKSSNDGPLAGWKPVVRPLAGRRPLGPPPPGTFTGPLPPPNHLRVGLSAVSANNSFVPQGPDRPPTYFGPQSQPTALSPGAGARPAGVVRLHEVRLTIKWLHHSEQRIFEAAAASIRSLQATALNYVRAHMDAFENVTPLDHTPNKAWTLRATLRQAFFGGEAYDMSVYRGDDLTKLFSVLGRNDIPRFDIEIDYIRSGLPAGVTRLSQPPPPPLVD